MRVENRFIVLEEDEIKDLCDGDYILQLNGHKICNECGVEFDENGDIQ